MKNILKIGLSLSLMVFCFSPSASCTRRGRVTPTGAQQQQILDKYRQGISVIKIASDLGLTPRMCQNVILKRGADNKANRPIEPGELDIIVRYRNELGDKWAVIASHLNCRTAVWVKNRYSFWIGFQNQTKQIMESKGPGAYFNLDGNHYTLDDFKISNANFGPNKNIDEDFIDSIQLAMADTFSSGFVNIVDFNDCTAFDKTVNYSSLIFSATPATQPAVPAQPAAALPTVQLGTNQSGSKYLPSKIQIKDQQ